MALSPGTRLGAYDISSLIGSGGMGEVYRARDTKLNRDVAIKVFPADVALDADRARDSSAKRKYWPPSIIPTSRRSYGYEDSEGVHALVLELVEGPTLADR